MFPRALYSTLQIQPSSGPPKFSPGPTIKEVTAPGFLDPPPEWERGLLLIPFTRSHPTPRSTLLSLPSHPPRPTGLSAAPAD
jgi:hypothetical protein